MRNHLPPPRFFPLWSTERLKRFISLLQRFLSTPLCLSLNGPRAEHPALAELAGFPLQQGCFSGKAHELL